MECLKSWVGITFILELVEIASSPQRYSVSSKIRWVPLLVSILKQNCPSLVFRLLVYVGQKELSLAQGCKRIANTNKTNNVFVRIYSPDWKYYYFILLLKNFVRALRSKEEVLLTAIHVVLLVVVEFFVWCYFPVYMPEVLDFLGCAESCMI